MGEGPVHRKGAITGEKIPIWKTGRLCRSVFFALHPISGENAEKKPSLPLLGFNGRHVIVVVLGCHPSRIWAESENLLKWALGDAA